MKIIACCKLVAEEQDINIKSDHSLDITRATYKINQFDLNAIQAAIETAALVEGCTVSALTIGGKALESVKLRKDILSRGVDDLYLVIDEQLDGALPFTTSQVLASAAQKIGFDLIICGDGSGDLYAQQTALLLGQRLNLPAINAISKIISLENGILTVERTLDDLIEVLEITLPAVIAVTGDINLPKIPAMKAILAAAKKTITQFTVAGLVIEQNVAPVVNESVLAPEQMQRQKHVIEGDGEEQVAQFVEILRGRLK